MTLAEIELEPEHDEAATGGAGELRLLLRLDGFAGSLDLLLELARTHRIDLKALDLLAVVEQLIQATQSGTGMPLNRKADWTVTASWLLLLRSHLMLPPADPHTRPRQTRPSGCRRNCSACRRRVPWRDGWMSGRS